jgi:hypothetical protein
MPELSLRDRILEILNRHQGQSERNEALLNLAKITRVSHRDIKELALSIEAEVDLGKSRIDRKTEVEKLLKIGKYGIGKNSGQWGKTPGKLRTRPGQCRND